MKDYTQRRLEEFEEKKYSIHKQSCDVMYKSGMQVCNCDGKSFLSFSIHQAEQDMLRKVIDRLSVLDDTKTNG